LQPKILIVKQLHRLKKVKENNKKIKTQQKGKMVLVRFLIDRKKYFSK